MVEKLLVRAPSPAPRRPAAASGALRLPPLRGTAAAAAPFPSPPPRPPWGQRPGGRTGWARGGRGAAGGPRTGLGPGRPAAHSAGPGAAGVVEAMVRAHSLLASLASRWQQHSARASTAPARAPDDSKRSISLWWWRPTQFAHYSPVAAPRCRPPLLPLLLLVLLLFSGSNAIRRNFFWGVWGGGSGVSGAVRPQPSRTGRPRARGRSE